MSTNRHTEIQMQHRLCYHNYPLQHNHHEYCNNIVIFITIVIVLFPIWQ